jgi:hypothetical protein
VLLSKNLRRCEAMMDSGRGLDTGIKGSMRKNKRDQKIKPGNIYLVESMN